MRQVYSVTRNFLLNQGIGVGGVQGRFFNGFQDTPQFGLVLMILCMAINNSNKNYFVPLTHYLVGLCS